jgi:hypothetical protein
MPRRDSRQTELVRTLHRVCEAIATGKSSSYEDFEAARKDVLEEPALAGALPAWLRKARSGSQYWAFIKAQALSYAERRAFLTETMDPLFTLAEIGESGPLAMVVSTLVNAGTADSVQAAWARCLERRTRDPEGAITASKSMLESTCKYILGEHKVQLNGREDLPKLYGMTAVAIGLSPGSQNIDVFKQILGGCHAVADGLASLRNRLGDAHGKSPKYVKPKARHATLAINLAGAMSVFLIETHVEKST